MSFIQNFFQKLSLIREAELSTAVKKYQNQTFILEPILTPSGFVDNLDNNDAPIDLTDAIDPALIDLDAIDPDPIDPNADVHLTDLGADSPLDTNLVDANLEPLEFVESDAVDPGHGFESGVFTVGDSGEVSIDFLFDGGSYQGELSIFNLEGMGNFDADPEAFIQEAASRALSNSEWGHIVISDRTEGARFSGLLGEENHNAGDYLGSKTFQMDPGDEFGLMLVPNGTVQTLLDQPDADGAIRPLFSMATANPDDFFHIDQIADVTGDGSTFIMEDLRVDTGSDYDYNDFIFQIRGATGDATDLSDILDPADDWRTTDMGQALIAYADARSEGLDYEPPITDFSASSQPLVGAIDTGFNANNPDIDYSQLILGRDRIDGDNNPLIATGTGDEHGTHILGIINAIQHNNLGIDGINDDAPIWVGRAVGSGDWADSLVEFVDYAKVSGQENAVINLSFDLTEINPDGSISTRYELTQLEREALTYAQQNDVLIVAGAGNQGGQLSALGQASLEFDNIVTVGAAQQVNDSGILWADYDRAGYSSYGYGLDLLANGGTPWDPEFSTLGEGVGAMAGSSVAAAKVTGAISQVWAANPDLSYSQVIDIVKRTATDLNAANWDPETGIGLLNMAAAIHLAKSTEPEAYIPEGFDRIQQWLEDNQIPEVEWPDFFQAYYYYDLKSKLTGPVWSSVAGAIAGERPVGFGSFIKKTFKKVVNVVKDVVGGIVDGVSDLWDGITDTVSDAWGSVTDWVSDAWSGIKDFAGDAFDKVTGWASDAWDGIKDIASGTWDKIKSWTSDAWDRVKEVAGDAWGWAKDAWHFVNDAWDEARDWASGAWDKVTDTVGDLFSDVGRWVSNAWDKVGDFWDEYGDEILGVGHTLLGLASQIPGIGTYAALINAGLYLIEGEYEQALRAGAFAIPGLGNAVALADAALALANGDYQKALTGGLAAAGYPEAAGFVDAAFALADGDYKGALAAGLNAAGVSNAAPWVDAAFAIADGDYQKALGTGLEALGLPNANQWVDAAFAIADGDYQSALAAGLNAAGVPNASQWVNAAFDLVEGDYRSALTGGFSALSGTLAANGWDSAAALANAASSAAAGDYQAALTTGLEVAGVPDAAQWVDTAFAVVEGDYQSALTSGLEAAGVPDAAAWVDAAFEIADGDYEEALKSGLSALSTTLDSNGFDEAADWVDIAVDVVEGDYEEALTAGLSNIGVDNAEAWSDTVFSAIDGDYQTALKSGLTSLGVTEANDIVDTVFAAIEGDYETALSTGLSALEDSLSRLGYDDAAALATAATAVLAEDYQTAVTTVLGAGGLENATTWVDAGWAVADGDYQTAAGIVLNNFDTWAPAIPDGSDSGGFDPPLTDTDFFQGETYSWEPYQIQPGDTLSAIALATMGSGTAPYYNFIAEKNGIENPHLIFPGDIILVPRSIDSPSGGNDGGSTPDTQPNPDHDCPISSFPIDITLGSKDNGYMRGDDWNVNPDQAIKAIDDFVDFLGLPSLEDTLGNALRFAVEEGTKFKKGDPSVTLPFYERYLSGIGGEKVEASGSQLSREVQADSNFQQYWQGLISEISESLENTIQNQAVENSQIDGNDLKNALQNSISVERPGLPAFENGNLFVIVHGTQKAEVKLTDLQVWKDGESIFWSGRVDYELFDDFAFSRSDFTDPLSDIEDLVLETAGLIEEAARAAISFDWSIAKDKILESVDNIAAIGRKGGAAGVSGLAYLLQKYGPAEPFGIKIVIEEEVGNTFKL